MVFVFSSFPTGGIVFCYGYFLLLVLNYFDDTVSVLVGFGGLEAACWPLVPKIAGSNPAEAVGF